MGALPRRPIDAPRVRSAGLDSSAAHADFRFFTRAGDGADAQSGPGTPRASGQTFRSWNETSAVPKSNGSAKSSTGSRTRRNTSSRPERLTPGRSAADGTDRASPSIRGSMDDASAAVPGQMAERAWTICQSKPLCERRRLGSRRAPRSRRAPTPRSRAPRLTRPPRRPPGSGGQGTAGRTSSPERGGSTSRGGTPPRAAGARATGPQPAGSNARTAGLPSSIAARVGSGYIELPSMIARAGSQTVPRKSNPRWPNDSTSGMNRAPMEKTARIARSVQPRKARNASPRPDGPIRRWTAGRRSPGSATVQRSPIDRSMSRGRGTNGPGRSVGTSRSRCLP